MHDLAVEAGIEWTGDNFYELKEQIRYLRIKAGEAKEEVTEFQKRQLEIEQERNRIFEKMVAALAGYYGLQHRIG